MSLPSTPAKKHLPLWLLMLVGALVIALVVYGIYAVSRPAPMAHAHLMLPEGIEQPVNMSVAPQTTQDAYAFAAAHYQELQYIPCYCGCNNKHHNNFECYWQHDENGKPTAYEEHAIGCQVCVDITRIVMKGMDKGTPLYKIRQQVDDAYKAQSLTPTDTPLPPKK